MNLLLVNLAKMVGYSGGMQKVACSFANEMKRRGHQVSLVYSDIQTGEFFYPIDKGIFAFDIRHYKGKTIAYPWYLKLKREFFRTFDKQKARSVNDQFESSFLLDNLEDVLNTVKPDVIVSFQSAASKLLLCDLKTEIPVITMSHGDTSDYFQTCPKEELPALEKSAVVQVLVPSFERPIKEHLPKVKTVVIGNAIPQYEEQANLATKKDHYKIIFVGRLAKGHKRPHLLIEAFAGLAKDFPNWTVELWGAVDGKAYYKELQMMISKNKLENQVFLKGTTNDVPAVLKNCDIFAITSAYEGFSLALGEAMSMGLPCVAFRSCESISGMVENEVTGVLCDDGAAAYKEGLRELMINQEKRIEIGQQAREAMRSFSPNNIWNTWEKLLHNVASMRSSKI